MSNTNPTNTGPQTPQGVAASETLVEPVRPAVDYYDRLLFTCRGCGVAKDLPMMANGKRDLCDECIESAFLNEWMEYARKLASALSAAAEREAKLTRERNEFMRDWSKAEERIAGMKDALSWFIGYCNTELAMTGTMKNAATEELRRRIEQADAALTKASHS